MMVGMDKFSKWFLCVLVKILGMWREIGIYASCNSKNKMGTNKQRVFLISPPYNSCNEGMQPILGDHKRLNL